MWIDSKTFNWSKTSCKILIIFLKSMKQNIIVFKVFEQLEFFNDKNGWYKLELQDLNEIILRLYCEIINCDKHFSINGKFPILYISKRKIIDEIELQLEYKNFKKGMIFMTFWGREIRNVKFLIL